MKIQIKDIEITLKSTFRTYIIFENITGKSFQNVATLSDILCFMYATILASTKNAEISFDEFMDYIDENPNVVTEFSDWMMKTNGIINEASNTLVDEDSSKKKTKRARKS